MTTWRPIEGFESRYAISSTGKVLRLARVGIERGFPYRYAEKLILPNRAGRLGYRQVHLYKDGKRHLRYVHALVLEAFVGPRPSPQHQCCHVDGNVANNRLYNLRWGTKADNMADVIRHGSQKGERNPMAKLCASKVRQIRQLRSEGYSVDVLSDVYGVSQDYIYSIANRKAWAHVI